MSDFERVRGIAAPARRALEAYGVKTVDDLGRFTEAEVAGWHGIGPTVMEALRGLMLSRGVAYARKQKE